MLKYINIIIIIIASYSVYDFADHSGPLFGFVVYVSTVEVFLYFERVIETAHFAELLDQIDSETLVTVVTFQCDAGKFDHTVRFCLQ